MAYIQKSVCQFKKWVTLKKYVIVKNGSHFKNVSLLEKRVTLKRCVKLEKIGHNWKNGSHLKNVSRKMGHI